MNLREYHCIKGGLTKGPEIAVGDVVILKNDSTKRLFRRLAIVQELLTGDDGKVRAAVIKIMDDQNKSRSLRRSIQHLIPIEARGGEKVSTPPILSSPDNESVSTEEVTTMTRPRRQAAVIGELNRRINQI